MNVESKFWCQFDDARLTEESATLKLQSELAALRARNERLVEALKSCEWQGLSGDPVIDRDCFTCPVCGAYAQDCTKIPHKSFCEIAAALKENQ